MWAAALAIPIAIVIFLLQILFALARAYILLLIYLIFAPIFILWGVTMGGGIWSSWLKGILTNLLVFLAVGIVMFIAKVLIKLTPSSIWGPPYIGADEAIIDGVIILGAIVLLSRIPDIINQLLEVRPIPLQLPDLRNITQLIGRINIGTGGGTCMPINTLVSTPKGLIFIQDLSVGDLIWTINQVGEKVATAIESVITRPAPQTHQMAYITLCDGRQVTTSPNHPTIEGVKIRDLRVGDILDNSPILQIEYLPYEEGVIFDILPSGETGGYWANGVLLGSTLFKGKQNIYQISI